MKSYLCENRDTFWYVSRIALHLEIFKEKQKTKKIPFDSKRKKTTKKTNKNLNIARR